MLCTKWRPIKPLLLIINCRYHPHLQCVCVCVCVCVCDPTGSFSSVRRISTTLATLTERVWLLLKDLFIFFKPWYRMASPHNHSLLANKECRTFVCHSNGFTKREPVFINKSTSSDIHWRLYSYNSSRF